MDKTPLYGDTFAIKEHLKCLGATWDTTQRVWMVPNDKLQEAKEALARVPKVKDPMRNDYSARNRCDVLFKPGRGREE